MDSSLAAALCEPKIEVGKASVYGVGSQDNMIAELDSDLSHCAIHGNEPANVRLRSFIPTEVGYHYRAQVKYRMRQYNNMPRNAYRSLVLGFAGNYEHFEPVFDDFHMASIDVLASRTFSPLVVRDNGLPDSYGILIDDIQVTQLQKAANYDECAALFAVGSKGFRRCILGEVDATQSCSMDQFNLDYHPVGEIAEDRQQLENALIEAAPVNGQINFLTLGKKGWLKASCYIDGYLAAIDVYNQKLSLQEISWNGATPESYPEQARVSVRLSHCDAPELNGLSHLGLVSTSESFNYEFTENEDGLSYAGCRLKKIIIQDKTPKNSPSIDGFDFNGLKIHPI